MKFFAYLNRSVFLQRFTAGVGHPAFKFHGRQKCFFVFGRRPGKSDAEGGDFFSGIGFDQPDHLVFEFGFHSDHLIIRECAGLYKHCAFGRSGILPFQW